MQKMKKLSAHSDAINEAWRIKKEAATRLHGDGVDLM